MRTGERLMWILLAAITGTLTLIAIGLVLWDHRGDRQMDECVRREGNLAGECEQLGDFHG